MLDPVALSGEPPPACPEKAAEGTNPAIKMAFAALQSAKAIVLAVSGGPDSIALMLMMADWAKLAEAPPLFVATVDHGLRPGSRDEAEQVALWANALGLSHRCLTWQGDKPKTRIQERARDARYALLCAYAKDVGADCLVTAHHADDQAETILFRLLRGSGLKGLSGMAAAMTREAIVHRRPLLGWTKDELVAFCQARGHAFFEDPSNRNPAYARTRLRHLSLVLSENGLNRDALLRLGKRLGRADAALQTRAMALSAGLINLEARDNSAAGLSFKADISSLRGESEEILGRILECLIQSAIGEHRFLRLDRLESVTAQLHAALAGEQNFSSTLGGAALYLSQKTYLTVRPEARRRRGRGKDKKTL